MGWAGASRSRCCRVMAGVRGRYTWTRVYELRLGGVGGYPGAGVRASVSGACVGDGAGGIGNRLQTRKDTRGRCLSVSAQGTGMRTIDSAHFCRVQTPARAEHALLGYCAASERVNGFERQGSGGGVPGLDGVPCQSSLRTAHNHNVCGHDAVPQTLALGWIGCTAPNSSDDTSVIS